MFVLPPIRQRLAGLGLFAFGKVRRCAQPPGARSRGEGSEDRCLLSITEFPPPRSGGDVPYQIAAGPYDNLWFAEAGNPDTNPPAPSRIGEINPTTHAITEFAIP